MNNLFGFIVPETWVCHGRNTRHQAGMVGEAESWKIISSTSKKKHTDGEPKLERGYIIPRPDLGDKLPPTRPQPLNLPRQHHQLGNRYSSASSAQWGRTPHWDDHRKREASQSNMLRNCFSTVKSRKPWWVQSTVSSIQTLYMGKSQGHDVIN